MAVLPIQLLSAVAGGYQAQVENSVETSSTPSGTEQAEKVTIEIRNGTRTPGLAGKLAEKLKAAGIETILKPRDASRKGYATTTTISEVVGNVSDATVKAIQEVMKVEVVDLPVQESGLKGRYFDYYWGRFPIVNSLSTRQK